MQFADKVLKCSECGTEFVFSVGEQMFFQDKKFAHDPKRCRDCRAKRARSFSKLRPETRTVCSNCGVETTVPFKPTKGGPCFAAYVSKINKKLARCKASAGTRLAPCW